MLEYRTLRGDQPDADEGKLFGRAAPFNSWTTIGGDKWGFREKVAPGAFKKSIAERDIVLLDNHNPDKPLARTSAGTLELSEKRDSGLHFDAKPAETSYGNDAMINVRAGNYGGMSFGFEVIKDAWKRGENGALDERTLEEVRLHEISVVTFPAYSDTDVSARNSIEAAREARVRALGPIENRDPDDGDADDAPKKTKKTKKPYGNVKYADPKNGKYPVDTLKHAKAAWSYINMPKNAAKYPLNGVSLASVKARIKAALKKLGVAVAKDEKNNDLAYDNAELRAFVDMALDEVSSPDVRDGLKALRDQIADATDPYADSFYEREDETEAESDEDAGREETSDTETREGESAPDDSTRNDGDDDIALRFSMIKLRSRDDIRP